MATDLSSAYIRAVFTHLPEEVHVFYHFPILKLYNDGLSDLRRQLYHEATHVKDPKVLKRTRKTFRKWTQTRSGPGLTLPLLKR